MDVVNWVMGRDPNNPLPSGPTTPRAVYGSGLPWIAPAEMNANPKMEAPSAQIGRAAGKLVGADSTLGERAWAPFEMVTGALGLPQEAATRVLTGNEYALPGDVPAVQSLFGSGPVGQFGANVLLDPLNLLGVPAARKALEGAVALRPLATKAMNFNELRLAMKEGWWSNGAEDLEKLRQKAGVWVPIVTDDTSKLKTFDFAHMPDDLAKQAQTALREAVKGFDISRFDPSDEANLITGAGREASRPSPVKQLQLWVGSPEKASAAAKTAIDTLADHQNAAALFLDDVMGEDKLFRALGDTDAWLKPGEDLGRAFTYAIFNRRDLFPMDKNAMEAMEAYGVGDFEKRVKAAWSVMDDALKLIPNYVPKGMEQSVSEAIKTAVRDVPDMPFPDELIQVLSGTTKVTANSANLKDSLTFFFRNVAKRAYTLPGADAVRNMIGHMDESGKLLAAGSIKNLSMPERDMLNRLLQHYEGRPDALDRSMTGFVSNYGDWLRQKAWGSELAAKARAGQRVDASGWRGWLGRTTERLITTAETGQYFGEKTSKWMTARLYDSMLGGAIDTAVKNLPQMFNNITRFGLGPALKGMGAFFTPEWQEALSAKRIIENSNALYEEAFRRAEWAAEHAPKSGYEKTMRLLRSPFQATENFNRGVTFITALNHHVEKGAPLGEALRAAQQEIKNLQFGYSLTDVSPYIRNPVVRPFFQFMTFPLKQAELLADMAFTKGGKGPLGFENEMVKYILYTGFATRYGEHLGIDVSQSFISGLFPQNLASGNGPSISAPVGNLVSAAAELGGEFLQRTLAGGGDPDLESPSAGWRLFGEFIKMSMPGGRYALKAVKQELESGGKAFGPLDPVQMLFSPDWNVRRAMADHPGLRDAFDTLNIRPDPGVDPLDRFAKMVGVRTLHDERRQEMMSFLKRFSQRFREAQSQINETAALGGDVAGVRERWVTWFGKNFGRQMARYNVTDYTLQDMLQVTISPNEMRKRRTEIESSNVEVLTNRLPKAVKSTIQIPEGY